MKKVETSKQNKLENLVEQCLKCNRCHLRKNVTQVVPGSGNANATIMFIGEAPGAHEDKQGVPFVGAAGKFLDELLESINLRREDIYIANTIKCRPPNNRDPLTEEKEKCKPWLEEQLRIINPKIIIPLGRHALNELLPDVSISSAHGKTYIADVSPIGKRTIFVMYHPAAALYNGSLRKVLLKDMKNLQLLLDKKLGDEKEPDMKKGDSSEIEKESSTIKISLKNKSKSKYESVEEVKRIMEEKRLSRVEGCEDRSKQITLF
ncbi:MAG TPA: uracil-DNA glycosylase [bacterium]|nr:uracil-DNA glycosylase [bacterium]